VREEKEKMKETAKEEREKMMKRIEGNKKVDKATKRKRKKEREKKEKEE
jgi:hypothetical protein